MRENELRIRLIKRIAAVFVLVVGLLLFPVPGWSQPQVIVSLSGTCTDAEDGDLSSTIVWSSDIDGSIGVGSAMNVPLTEGNHVISASCTDSKGQTASASVNHTVDDNAMPVVIIIEPEDGGCTGTNCP